MKVVHTLTGDIGGRNGRFSFKLESHSEFDPPSLYLKINGYDNFDPVENLASFLDICKIIEVREADKSVYYWIICNVLQNKGGGSKASMLEMVYACTEASVEITSFSKRMAQNYELVETPIQDGIKYTVRRKESNTPSVNFT